MRRLLSYLMLVTPNPMRRWIACYVLRWDIHPTAHLGRSLFLRVGHVSMGPGATIGPRNLFRGIEELRLGPRAVIAEGNRVVGLPRSANVFPGVERRPALVMGEHAELMIGHEIDCSDLVEIEHHAALVGYHSVILTHSLDLMTDTWIVRPVRIGHHAMIMSGCHVLVGADVAPCSAISAGSVVNRPVTESYTLYRGNPAVAVRSLSKDSQMFRRSGRFGSGPS